MRSSRTGRHPLDGMIDANVTCTRCGTKGVGNCDCWEPCGCGWSKGRGEPCDNPACPTNKKRKKK